ncbi:MAG: glutamyl-tRNA reductase, partial [Eubacteriales bacterium]|nr:glutamyl-tRNA reductase [Eubacteriales bacterium]
IVNQLLHEPITRLKDYAQTPEGYHFAEALQKLFDLDTGDNKKSEKRPAVYRRKSGR